MIRWSRVCVTLFLALCLTCWSTSVAAQTNTNGSASVATQAASAGQDRGGDTWLFENRAYYDPLVAEPRAAQISVLVLAYSKEFQYQVNPGTRRVWDISVGKEIPIFGRDSRPTVNGLLPPNSWGFGVWTPVSFHVVEDFKDDSNPIINTDYRFAGQAKFQYRFESERFLGVKFQAGHESTHLGDEFTLFAEQTHDDFERINVSYEYWEYGVSYEFLHSNSGMLVKLRQGGIGLFGNDGFYSDHLLEAGGREIAISKNNFEPSFGVEVTPTEGGWRPFASLDLRLRTVYDYNKASSDQSEDRQPSVGVAVGLRNGRARVTERGLPDLFFRGYYGVNPNGQFRNQKNYWQVGIGIYVRV
jgi:Protein of unknown function (DUF1207)